MRVKSTDNGGLTVDKVFLIKIYNRNEVPLNIIIDTTSVIEDNEQMTYVSKIRTIDTDNPDYFTYDLVAGSGAEDNAEFMLDGDKLIIVTKTNYDVKSVYHIRVKSTDYEGLSLEKAFDSCNELKIKTLLGFIFDHNKPSLELFYKMGFEKWAHLPKIANMIDAERGLIILGKRIH